MSHPLSGLRLVATLPPRDWFGGVDHARARDQIAALTKLGASVYEFDVASMYMPDRSQLQAQIEGIRAFKPDAVIGTPHAGYAVQGGMANVESGRPCNIFFDQLFEVMIDQRALHVRFFCNVSYRETGIFF